MHLTTLLLAITAALPITFAVPAAATAAKCPDDNPKAYCCKVYGPETPGECPTGVCAEGIPKTGSSCPADHPFTACCLELLVGFTDLTGQPATIYYECEQPDVS